MYHDQIAKDFCQYYYHLWDTNFPLINNLYTNDSKITYLEREFNNFNYLLNYIKYVDKIYRFDHISVTALSQIIDNNTILINVVGVIAVNDICFRNFNESIILKRNVWEKYYITNSIFRLSN